MLENLERFSLLRRILLGLLVTAFVSAATGARAVERKHIYAVVVATNHSLDTDVSPLRFADDDGAKYFELFSALGAEVSLLTVLDPVAQRRFPAAAKAARVPYKRDVLATVRHLFEKMEKDKAQGIETHFVFIYSGHGNVGPNREGYINLQDAKFGRSELYGEILAPSPASFNHLILDACDSYYFVKKRGQKTDKTGDYRAVVRDFLRSEELRNYPNTGVILASSADSETHEWGRWEAGIFSHELRSALLGAGDVDGDGIVTYAEAAACVEAANAAIDVPKARLKVYHSPPAINVDTPLVDLNALSRTTKVRVEKTMTDRYHVEDARGVRVADFHFSNEQQMVVALVGKSPFFMRTDQKEASISGDAMEVRASELAFSEIAAANKGSLEQSFRRHLYQVPFGKGFYAGARSAFNQGEPMSAGFGEQDTMRDTGPSPVSPMEIAGWTTLSAGVLTGVASGLVYYSADMAYQDYKDADNQDDMDRHKETSEDRLTVSRFLLVGASALAVTGATLLIVDAVKKKRAKEKTSMPVQPVVAQVEGGLYLGVTGTW